MKIIRFCLLFIVTMSLISCGGLFLKNRFAKSRDRLYFGEYSGDFDKECKDYKNPNQDFFGYGLTVYKNGTSASRACIHYQEYLCRINITCKKYSDEKERERCNFDAANYWLPDWDSAHNNLEKKVEISKKVCEASALKNNQPQK